MKQIIDDDSVTNNVTLAMRHDAATTRIPQPNVFFTRLTWSARGAGSPNPPDYNHHFRTPCPECTSRKYLPKNGVPFFPLFSTHCQSPPPKALNIWGGSRLQDTHLDMAATNHLLRKACGEILPLQDPHEGSFAVVGDLVGPVGGVVNLHDDCLKNLAL